MVWRFHQMRGHRIMGESDNPILLRIGHVSEQVGDLKKSVDELTLAVNTMNARVLSNTMRLDNLQPKVDQMDKDLESLEKSAAPIFVAHKILVWVAAAIGITIIAFLWSILVHQVEVFFP